MLTREELSAISSEYVTNAQGSMQEVQDIGKEIFKNAGNTTKERFAYLEERLVGVYAYINTQYRELEAKTGNLEALYYTHLRNQAAVDNKKFVSETAKVEADEYVQDIRLAEAILLGYVEVLQSLMKTCHARTYNERKVGNES